MSEKQTVAQAKAVRYVDPFTGRVAKTVSEVPQKEAVDWNVRPVLGVELDKDTGNTVVVSTGVVDVDQEIQQRKNDCGFEGMRKLIATGQARPIDFMDDGKHSGDISGLPDNVNDAYRAAQAASAQGDNLFKTLGVKTVFNSDGSINIEATEKAITAAIQAKADAAKAKTEEVNEDASK